MKHCKVVCFCWPFFGLTLHKICQNTKMVMSAHTSIEALRVCNSCTVSEHKTNYVNKS